MKKLILVSVMAALSFGCAHGPDKRMKNFTGEEGVFSSEKKGESVTATVYWAKNKPKALDVNMMIKNEGKKPVFLKVRNFLGEIEGEKSMEVRPDYYIQLQPGDIRADIFAFRFAADKNRSGKAKLVFPIHEGTMETPGKEVKSLTIEFPVEGAD